MGTRAALAGAGLTGVVVSLYPAGTVLLAVTVLRERPSAIQVAGFALTAVGLVLIGLG